jgi:hypothetical protein
MEVLRTDRSFTFHKRLGAGCVCRCQGVEELCPVWRPPRSARRDLIRRGRFCYSVKPTGRVRLQPGDQVLQVVCRDAFACKKDKRNGGQWDNRHEPVKYVVGQRIKSAVLHMSAQRADTKRITVRTCASGATDADAPVRAANVAARRIHQPGNAAQRRSARAACRKFDRRLRQDRQADQRHQRAQRLRSRSPKDKRWHRQSPVHAEPAPKLRSNPDVESASMVNVEFTGARGLRHGSRTERDRRCLQRDRVGFQIDAGFKHTEPSMERGNRIRPPGIL